MKKHSVKIAGHDTSISLEDEFWAELKRLAKREQLSLNELISRIDEARTHDNLCSAIRIYILADLQTRI